MLLACIIGSFVDGFRGVGDDKSHCRYYLERGLDPLEAVLRSTRGRGGL
jgi:hypothetical protein